MQMSGFEPYVDLIAERYGVSFRAAPPEHIAILEELGLPSEAIDFFSRYEPSSCIDGPRRLWPIPEFARENIDSVPGCYVFKHGYIVFATNISGDPCCFDMNDNSPDGPQVVQFWHDDSLESKSREELEIYAYPIAANFVEFLDLFIGKWYENDR
jgi:hypothetical protein